MSAEMVSIALLQAIESAAKGGVFTPGDLAAIGDRIATQHALFRRLLAAAEDVAWSVELDGDDDEWDDAACEFHEAISAAREAKP